VGEGERVSGAPQRVGRWPVKRLLGQGGFSWVYEVDDENLGVRRALKMLKPEAGQGEGYKRFWREARILASIDDPHLVRIYELDRDAATGADYYVMEFLTGSDLAKLLKEGGPLPVERAIQVLLGALQGLARLHAQKPPVIHRDIKPANIQITDEGIPKLLDLGIARMVRPQGDETVIGASEITTLASFMGTVKYASPEQLRVRDLTASSDVFSMGLALYESIEGRHPYGEQPDLPTQSYQDVLGYYAQLEAVRGELKLRFERTPKALQSVVRRALAVSPQQRFADAGEMRAALVEAAEGKSASPAPRAPARPSSRGSGERSLRIVPLAGGALALLLIAGGAYYFLGRGSPAAPPGLEEPAAPKETASADALASRNSAREIAARLAAAQAEGRLAGEAAAPVRAVLAQADADWDAGSFAAASRGYDDARMRATDLLAGAAPAAQPAPDLAALEEQARSARDAATTAQAPQLASAAFARGESALAAARTAAGSGRSAEAAVSFASARDAYRAAGAEAARGAAASAPLEVNAPPQLAVSPKGPLALEVGQQAAIVTSTRDAEGDRVVVEYVVRAPGGGRTRHSGERFTFAPTAPGEHRIEVVATDARGASSPPVEIFARVKAAPAAIPEPAPTQAATTAPPLAAGGAVSGDVRSLLDEYADAIRGSDLQALKIVWRMDPNSERLFERLFSTYASMAVSVTPQSEQVSGGSANVRFVQSLQGISPEGKLTPISEGPMVAELTKRGDGWQITSLRRAQ